MTKHTFFTLTPEQRRQLESRLHAGQCAARQQTRARILLLLDRAQDKPRPDREIAALLGCHANTVGNVRRRFCKEGLEAVLTDKPMGPTTPRKVTGELEARLSALACSQAPEGQARWTLRLLAERVVELGYVESLSYATVSALLKKTNSNLGACKPGASAHRARRT